MKKAKRVNIVKSLFAILILTFKILGTLKANHSETFMVKRAFLEGLHRLPTVDEVDWCFYIKDNSYEYAVNYILSLSDEKSKKELEAKLKSNKFKTSKRVEMTKAEIFKGMLFLIYLDTNLPYNDYNKKLAYDRLVEIGIKYSDDEEGAIDYIANLLMCRTTTVKELNQLRIIVNDDNTRNWHKIIDSILDIEDAKTK